MKQLSWRDVLVVSAMVGIVCFDVGANLGESIGKRVTEAWWRDNLPWVLWHGSDKRGNPVKINIDCPDCKGCYQTPQAPQYLCDSGSITCPSFSTN